MERCSQPILVLRHVPGNGLFELERPWAEAGYALSYLNVFERGDRPFPSMEDYAGLIILGGYDHIHEVCETRAMRQEVAFVKRAIESGKPIFGICLGSQLLSVALGGSVCQNPVREEGWVALTLTDAAKDDPVFGDCEEPLVLFQWHDDTYTLPPGAVQLASSSLCPQQAFRYGHNVYAVQFHPEINEATIRQWVDESSTLSPERAQAILEETEQHKARRLEAGRALMHRFIQTVFPSPEGNLNKPQTINAPLER